MNLISSLSMTRMIGWIEKCISFFTTSRVDSLPSPLAFYLNADVLCGAADSRSPGLQGEVHKIQNRVSKILRSLLRIFWLSIMQDML